MIGGPLGSGPPIMLSAKLALAAIVLIMLGCGSTTQSRTELTAKANAICRRVIDEVDWRRTPPVRLVLLARRLGALEIQASAELAKFNPPGSIAGYWQAMADDFEATGQEFDKLAASPKLSAQEAFYAIEPVLNAMRERAAMARISGLAECSTY